MIRLRMHLGRDGLEHKRYSVASQDGKEVVIFVAVTSALITNVKPQLGLVERKRSAQVVDNKKGHNIVQHSDTAVDSNINLLQAVRAIGRWTPVAQHIK